MCNFVKLSAPLVAFLKFQTISIWHFRSKAIFTFLYILVVNLVLNWFKLPVSFALFSYYYELGVRVSFRAIGAVTRMYMYGYGGELREGKWRIFESFLIPEQTFDMEKSSQINFSPLIITFHNYCPVLLLFFRFFSCQPAIARCPKNIAVTLTRSHNFCAYPSLTCTVLFLTFFQGFEGSYSSLNI